MPRLLNHSIKKNRQSASRGDRNLLNLTRVEEQTASNEVERLNTTRPLSRVLDDRDRAL